MPIVIRGAEERDAELLAMLNRFVQDIHVAALPEYFKSPADGAVGELFRSKLRRSDVRIWIASIGDLAVGYAVSIVRERSETALNRPRKFHELDEICVAPDHRRDGVGRALVERVVSEARLRGISDVELSSWAFNAEAHAAFRALGFEALTVRFRRPTSSQD